MAVDKDKAVQLGAVVEKDDDDTLYDAPGDDTLESEEGDDTLESSEGDDTLESEEGDDTLESEEGADELSETLEADIEDDIEKGARKFKVEQGRLTDIQNDIVYREQEIVKRLPNYKFGDKTIYELTDKEFTKAIRAIYTNTEIPADQKDATAEAAEAARDKYFDELNQKGLVEKNRQYMEKDAKLWNDQWMLVQEAILKANPKLAPFLSKVDKAMKVQFEQEPLLVQRLKRGPVEKFHYALDIMERLDIDIRLAEAQAKDLKPAPRTVASVGKGKKSGNKASQSPAYKDSQVQAMSMDEFSKHEKAIDKAIKAGRYEFD